MFNKKFQQYIDIIKYNNQVKLSYKKIQDGKVVNKEQKTFLQKQDSLHPDIVFKINTFKKENPSETFVSTILTSKDQNVFKNDDKIDKNEYAIAKLDEKHFIGIKSHLLFEIKHHFSESSLDRLYSPFHIITKFKEKNDCKDSLVVFIYDNHLYMLFFGDNLEIKDFKIEEMIKFEDIQESEFYHDEISRQKLYDEYYSLYFNQIINEKIKDFYDSHDSVFVQKVIILYNVKHLSDDDIEDLENDLMISVNSYAISLDDYIYSLSSSKESVEKSLVNEPHKNTSPSKKLISLFVISVLIIVAILGYYLYLPKKVNNEKISNTEVTSSTESVAKPAILPNHINLNRNLAKRILREFDLIPYNVLLKEAAFSQKDSSYRLNFLERDTYVKDMYPTLSKVYEETSISFEDTKDSILKGLIKNTDLKDRDFSTSTENRINYIIDEKIDTSRITLQLKNIFNADTIVVFDESIDSNKLSIAIYRISTILASPIEFYELVEDLNKEMYSMVIDYPLSFRMSELGLEVDFVLKFYQLNK